MVEEILRQLKELKFEECSLESVGLKVGSDNITFYESESTDWIDEGKYQYSTSINQVYVNDNREPVPDLYLAQHVTRSGSYFTDYHYDYEAPYVAEKVTKTITVERWVAK